MNAGAVTRYQADVAETILNRQARHRAIRASGRLIPGVATAALFAFSADSAFAHPLFGEGTGFSQILWLAITAGFAGAATIALSLLLRRDRDNGLAAAQQQIARLKQALDRSEALLASDDQKTLCWSRPDAAADVHGTLPSHVGAPTSGELFLDFFSWLEPRSAEELQWALDQLWETGEAFHLSLRTQTDCFLEANGRTSGPRVILRLRELTGERRSFAELKEQAGVVIAEMTALRSLAEALPFPLWRRNQHGRLSWANSAYVQAVGAPDLTMVTTRGTELLEPATRGAVREAHRDGAHYHAVAPVEIAGAEKQMEIFDIKVENGTIGLAIDVTEVETARQELKQNIEVNSRLLDQLSTAIAVFDGEARLQFANAAFRALWDLPARFLATGTEEGVLLDQIRAERRLPEQANYREWRRQHLEHYADPQPREEMWHLPDRRSFRMIATPNQQGGFTYIYENVTERLSLESRVNTLSRMQGETLDHLSEAVGVFGSDGRLRLYNPVLAEMWQLSPDFLKEEPHISTLIGHWMLFFPEQGAWTKISNAITRMEAAESLAGRMERRNGSIIEYSTVPLPQGMTLLTFADVTEKAEAHRFLEERNRLLEETDRLKSDFIQHVSYELRSPLTSIIGFAQILAAGAAGELNAQQREYMDHIAQSSDSLLVLINNILDLATVDAGIMELEIDKVDISEVVHGAVVGVRDRIEEKDIDLFIQADETLGNFRADASRVRQILYNLLSNAINFSPSGSRVEIRAQRQDGSVVFVVRDQGPGIPPEIRDDVFEPFEGTAPEGGRRGAGLGLSIVKRLVELHQGDIAIDSEPGEGTTSWVRLPADISKAQEAAE